jgi:hypothetical protein
MPAHTHPRSLTRSPGVAGGQLPWWALALPVIAFCALLLLIAGPGQAHAEAGDGQGLGDFLRLVHRMLVR